MASEQILNLYKKTPGGPELIRWFGGVPSFHDAEIVSLELRRWGQSTLCVHGFVFSDQTAQSGSIALDKHAIVTFVMEDIMDLQLDGFSPQNVIGGLKLQSATDRGRNQHYPLPPSRDDIEIELEPCYGLDGFIRAKRLTISLRPGLPDGPTIYRDESRRR